MNRDARGPGDPPTAPGDRVRDWMTTAVITVDPEMSATSAHRLLWSNGIRHLPALSDGRLVGMVSDRDLRAFAPRWPGATEHADDASDDRRSVRAVMMTAVQTVWPDDTVVYAASVMAQWRIGALPVVEDGHLVGIITTTDCLRALVGLHRTADLGATGGATGSAQPAET